MKTNYDQLFMGAVIGLLCGTLISTAVLYETTSKQHEYEADPSPVIIWNDDTESIPADGELVRLEMTQNDTIYIGPK
jgi:hypothetical protein